MTMPDHAEALGHHLEVEEHAMSDVVERIVNEQIGDALRLVNKPITMSEQVKDVLDRLRPGDVLPSGLVVVEKGQRLYDLGNGHAININPGGRFDLWLFAQHADGQWISVAKLTKVAQPFVPAMLAAAKENDDGQ